ncbi:MAG: hypothetical protein J6K64_04990 [Clostridia bacterium]|nr:hypothetical protein [Clostridia bacterium]
MKLKNKTDTDLQVCYGEEKVKLFSGDEAELLYNQDLSEITVSEYYVKPDFKEKLFSLLLGSFIAILAGEEFTPMSEYFKFPVRFKTDGNDIVLVKSHRLYEICAINADDTEENGMPIITKEEIKQLKTRYYSEYFAMVFIPLVILLCILAAMVAKKSFKEATIFAITLALVLTFVILLIRFSKLNRQTLEKLNQMTE